MIVTGVTCAVGFGALAVLMLGLHAEVRRLTKLAEALQASLQANLRELLADSSRHPAPAAAVSAAAAPPHPAATPATTAASSSSLRSLVKEQAAIVPPPPPPPPAAPEPPESEQLDSDPDRDPGLAPLPSIAQLAAATTSAAQSNRAVVLPADPPAAEPGPHDLATRWNPDRRLLVMRLSARGNRPDQIAAALRIPLEEIELFLKLNKLVKPSPPPLALELEHAAIKTETHPAD